MKHKKLFLLTFFTVLASSVIAWQVGRTMNHYRGSKGARFCDDCTIQALLRGETPQEELSLIPPENTQPQISNPDQTGSPTPKTGGNTRNIENMVDHR